MIHSGKKVLVVIILSITVGFQHPWLYIYSIWKKVLFYENLSDLTSFSKLNMEKSPIFENLSDLTSFVYIYDEFS